MTVPNSICSIHVQIFHRNHLKCDQGESYIGRRPSNNSIYEKLNYLLKQNPNLMSFGINTEMRFSTSSWWSEM